MRTEKQFDEMVTAEKQLQGEVMVTNNDQLSLD